MASLNLSACFDVYDPKKLNLPAESFQWHERSSVFSITSSMHNVGCCRAYAFSSSHSSSRASKQVRVSPLETGVSTECGSNLGHVESSETVEVDNSASERSNPRARGPVKGESERGVNSNRSCWVRDEFDANLSLEECNSILKRLERGCNKDNDDRAIRFYEWMRSSGKLRGNATAYSLILRVLSRREEWDMAEEAVHQMKEDSGCELDFRVFNTLIYSCYKKGRVKIAGTWFRLMLEYRVEPNVATIGMMMSLYQKSWKVEDAEFTFALMREQGIQCQSAYSALITIYTRLRLYDKAEDVIALAREDGIVLNSENWLVMLNVYSQQGKLEEAEKIMLSMQEAGCTLNIVAYNMLITGYGKASKIDAAERLFQRIRGIGMEPDETTYRSMIEGWGRADNYEMTIWYYKELKRLGWKPNASNMYTLINLQAKYGDEATAAAILDDMVKMGSGYSSILGTLLQAYERAGRISQIPLLLKGSFYQHILVNQSSCSTLVMAYVKNFLLDDAIAILWDKQWKDPTFEDNLYHLLICSCKESGRLEDAVKIYTQMPKLADKPNVHIVSTMIDVYTVMGLFTEAEELYMKLKCSNVTLDVVAFSIVVRMYIKAGSLKDACLVLELMEKQKDIVPDVFLFRDMLRIYQKLDMRDKLQDVYCQILKSGLTWDQEMYNCVINCCSRALPVDELSRLFDEMLLRGFSPNTVTFNVMLDVYGKAKLFKKLTKVFSLGRKQGLLDVVSYNTLIAAYGQNKDFMSMSSAVEEMQFDGFSVSLEAFNCMLDAYGKDEQMESFRNVLQRLKQSSCSSDHYTYNILMNVYGEQGWIDGVAKVLRELKECKMGPDLCSYNTLIKAYGIAGMVEDAVSLVKEMREKGIGPDKVTYINLIAALKRNDKYLEAIRWSLWMKQMGL
ncbi:hypothetical protein CDL15_Pgr012625 [Punica granatum]|uniref:Pentatricopeptide repeat-containing protein At4g30825, chloroplastic n=1 Tax=Punica granatum TaxID=22663 RepID=A0A218XYV2_PUNGR|nr:hypothetical protein CDL15_Pgr012625 [Punica granatum]